MGGGKAPPAVLQSACELGRRIAEHGWVLLNGGRDAGVMAASAEGAARAGGLVVGILPDRNAAAACPDLGIAVVTGMGDARNVINVLSSDVVIACPGGAGTLSEVALALKSVKPVILLDWDAGPAFEPYQRSGLLHSARDPAEAIALVERLLGKPAGFTA